MRALPEISPPFGVVFLRKVQREDIFDCLREAIIREGWGDGVGSLRGSGGARAVDGAGGGVVRTELAWRGLGLFTVEIWVKKRT